MTSVSFTAFCTLQLFLSAQIAQLQQFNIYNQWNKHVSNQMIIGLFSEISLRVRQQNKNTKLNVSEFLLQHFSVKEESHPKPVRRKGKKAVSFSLIVLFKRNAALIILFWATSWNCLVTSSALQSWFNLSRIILSNCKETLQKQCLWTLFTAKMCRSCTKCGPKVKTKCSYVILILLPRQ